MTVIPKESFSGATRRGIEDIRAAIEQANKTTSAAINETLENNDETLVEIFNRSERASEIDWVNFKKSRERVRQSLKEAPLFLACAFALISVLAAVLLPLAEALKEPPQDIPPLSFIMGFMAVIMAYPFASTLLELLKERRLGYTGWFKSQMRYRLNSAWAISKEAIYAARLNKTDEELIEVVRVPFHEVQACTYADYDGLQVAHLYTKGGQIFVLAEPAGKTLTGAANLANYIWSLTKGEPEKGR
ncbi:hypothetical protein [Rhizobium sp. MHM7A]|uniref:hypothetical protein n=1 Tax=Rhizobium sp. MHM7A TaxID=2583233 RepID=UPI0011074513|nr:hypothetical protein [Rhizobium sp. MHM7A]TLX16051.1 hypothetical protein FFR93_01655 [Rhizobium sp. MHM7A]